MNYYLLQQMPNSLRTILEFWLQEDKGNYDSPPKKEKQT